MQVIQTVSTLEDAYTGIVDSGAPGERGGTDAGRTVNRIPGGGDDWHLFCIPGSSKLSAVKNETLSESESEPRRTVVESELRVLSTEMDETEGRSVSVSEPLLSSSSRPLWTITGPVTPRALEKTNNMSPDESGRGNAVKENYVRVRCSTGSGQRCTYLSGHSGEKLV